MAHDLDDIIWENYYQVNKSKQLLFVILAYFLLCGCLWFAAFFIEYQNTKDNLMINFIDKNWGFTIHLYVAQIRTSFLRIGLSIVKFILQLVGWFVIDVLLTFTKFSYYSSSSNFHFIFISLYELIYIFPMTYYGYTNAVFEMKGKLDEEDIDPQMYFSKVNMEWLFIALIIFFSATSKFLIFWLKGIYHKFKQRHNSLI